MSERDAVELLLKQTEALLVRTRRQIDALTARDDQHSSVYGDLRDGSERMLDDDFEPRPRF